MKTFAKTLPLLFVLAALTGFSGKKPDRTASTAAAQQKAALTAPVQGDMVWVAKPDEATSCNVNSGISIDRMGQELGQAGIKFNEKKKIYDDKLRIEMCGADKGTMNGFLISTNDVEKAKSMGFQVVPQTRTIH